ncbi:RNA-binding protein [Candidatus Woesearchaeota archaeon]|nr:MAG: RNA-binding protein [Candidatus Woesearchaeota archaeon ex4484_78]RLE45683.1 MAG: RNA-binding protein [Candidatus Woesearchaeota archaeon]
MKETILVKDKDIVVPGETVAQGMSFLPGRGLYRKDEKIIAQKLGMINVEGKVIKLIPLSGKYIPRVNDNVVAQVIDVLMTGWRVDINSAYSAMLTMKDATSEFIPRGADLTQYFSVGDFIVCKIVNVTSQKLVDVSMKGPGLRKLTGGRIIKVNSHKVPRVIGKEGSMVTLIKQNTGCNITIGQNGLVWIKGEPEGEIKAVQAIRLVEELAHTSGLTDRISEFFNKQGKTKKAVKGGEK